MFSTETIPTWMVAKSGCYICSATDGLVSTGVEIEGEGVLCLCRGHVHDMAIACGFRLEDEERLTSVSEERDRYRTALAVEHEKAFIAERRYDGYVESVRQVLQDLAPDTPQVERPKNLRDPISGKLVKRP